MKTKVKVNICDQKFTLRTIDLNDAEVLRLWKNDHKEFFFCKLEISHEDQKSWIKSLSERKDDHMFIIMHREKPIGCIGVRLYQEFADIYNVILGDKEYRGKHLMTNALKSVVSLCTLIFDNKPVRVRVLRTNPAIKWYEKIGFNIIDYYDDHVVMQYRTESINEKYDFDLNITLPLK